jgi:EAL domain-containing protein (putative c-di-GMP-specific phosphodiesterase class I)
MGYSSLGALHLIPVECLKIDKTFVQRIGPRGENAELVEAIVAMAKSLGLKTIAEGVETRSQLHILRQIGCGYGQGYLFSPPVPDADAQRLLLVRRNRLGR